MLVVFDDLRVHVRLASTEQSFKTKNQKSDNGWFDRRCACYWVRHWYFIISVRAICDCVGMGCTSATEVIETKIVAIH